MQKSYKEREYNIVEETYKRSKEIMNLHTQYTQQTEMLYQHTVEEGIQKLKQIGHKLKTQHEKNKNTLHKLLEDNEVYNWEKDFGYKKDTKDFVIIQDLINQNKQLVKRQNEIESMKETLYKMYITFKEGHRVETHKEPSLDNKRKSSKLRSATGLGF